MFTKAKIALAAAIVVCVAFSASAAIKPRVTHAHRTATNNVVPGNTPQTHLDPDDPALTGDGSLGYNRNIYGW